MSYDQGSHSYNTSDDRPMLEPVDDGLQETALNDSQNDDFEYNEEAEREANQLLEDLNDILPKSSETSTKECDSPEVSHQDHPIPLWYKRKLESKIRETKDRLELLSNLVCNVCPLAAAHIKRIEQDHSTTFCKMDYPRHPSLDKPWTNSWKFNCTIKCKESDKPNHIHISNCESQVVLEHVDTGVSVATSNICSNEYPEFVMDAVKLFQDFANETIRNIPFTDVEGASDAAYEITMWAGVKLVVRSNYKKKLMIVVRGKRIGSIRRQLKWFFNSGPGRHSEVISVSAIGQTWSRKKGIIEPEHITGLYRLNDRIGSISIDYKPKISADFNSVETAQVAEIIKDYAGLTSETTLLDIGCNFGVLSLMMSEECERVIGLNTMHSVNNEIVQAEEIKQLNRIENVSFIGCDPDDIITKCSPLCKGYITVAILNLATPYGKSKNAIEALRNIPSIWRVIVYGSFTKEFRTNIVKLTTENDSNGEHFLPMQGCILDKSLSVENAFDIFILFERKSLINPKVELKVLNFGPTMNVKLDSETFKFESLDAQESKPELSVDTSKNVKNSRETDRKSPPYTLSSRSSRKYNRSPSPRRSDRPPSPRRSVRPPSPRRSIATDRQFDRSIQQKSHPVPFVHKEKDTAVYPSTSKEFRVIVEPKEDRLPPRHKKLSPSSTTREKSFDCLVLRKDNQLEKEKNRSLHNERLLQQSRDKTPFLYPSLSVKKEFQFTCPTPPQERLPSPPPPPPPLPTDISLLDDSTQIKKEKDAGYSPWTIVKSEPMQLQGNEEESGVNNDGVPSQLVTDENVFLPVTIKSEPVDCHDISSQLETGENVPLPVTVKSEPSDPPEVPSHLRASELNIPLPATSNEEPMDCHDVLSQFETDQYVPTPATIKSELENSGEGPSQLVTNENNLSLSVTIKVEPVDFLTQMPFQVMTGRYRPVYVSDTSDSEPDDPREVPSHLMTSELNISSPETSNEESMDCHDDLSQPETDENESLSVTVKSELVDDDDDDVVTDENELQGSHLSPNSQAIEDMESPIYSPRPLNSSKPLVSANLDGFEFSLEANKSYIPLTRDSESSSAAIKTEPTETERLQMSANISIKAELEEGEREETDEELKIVDEKKTNIIVKTESSETDEIKIIDEKRSKPQMESKPRIRVKNEDELIEVKSELEEDDLDLRTLIKQREEILQKLNQEKDTKTRRYRRHSSRSSRKHNRSFSPRRSARSPSSRRSIRSPSPRRSARSPSPRRSTHSPSPRRSARSPSPRRSARSPSPRRSARSPSPYRCRSPSSKRHRRSPYRSRKSPSPSYRHSKRSPTSSTSVKREPHSPDRSERVNSRRGDRSRKLTSSSSSKREVYGRTSPVKSSHDRRKRSRSRSPKRRKSKSPSRASAK